VLLPHLLNATVSGVEHDDTGPCSASIQFQRIHKASECKSKVVSRVLAFYNVVPVLAWLLHVAA
jgi:hypothetical protein